MRQLGELQNLLTKELRTAVQILAVSVDSREDSQKLLSKLKAASGVEFDFPLLADKGHKVIDRYGILSPDGKGWPHPATYVIDKAGTVRWRFVEVDYTKRPTHEQILEALGKLP